MRLVRPDEIYREQSWQPLVKNGRLNKTYLRLVSHLTVIIIVASACIYSVH